MAARSVDVPGAAHLVLAPGVAYLDPATAVCEGMLEGWARQQRVRFLKAETIKGRIDLVRRLLVFSNQYPWQWRVMEVEALFDHLQSGSRPIVESTGRRYAGALRLFLEYVTDARYGWPAQCLERFGEAPQQLLDELNTRQHVTEYEGQPGRRPLSYGEVQALFDAADARVEEIRARRRKGSLAAFRDSTILKTIYAYGLRRREAWGLDIPDLGFNAHAKEFGRCGALFVRWGKSSRGSPPKRRTVLLVPEMDWVVEPLNQWLDEARPILSPGRHPAVWVTERLGRLAIRGVNEAFDQARADAGLDPVLDLHCLRHSFVTHLIEFGYPERFVQEQAGHEYASSTKIYDGVSDDYRNRLLAGVLRDRHPEFWENTS